MSANQPSSRAVAVLDYGFTTISNEVSNPIADVVFVHGLGGHPQKTWSTDEHSPKASAEPRRPKIAAIGDKVSHKVGKFFKGKQSLKKTTRSSSATREGESVNESGSEFNSIDISQSPLPITATSAPSKARVFWPRDLLGPDFEELRILTFGYESNPAHSSQNNLYTLSKSLLARLASERENCETRPLIFVCHSLGGILVKFALKLAQDSSGAEASFQTIRTSTRGVIFFATPHSGSDLADWGELVRRIAGVFKVTNSSLLAALNAQSDNGQLEQLRDDFSKILGPRTEGKIRVQNLRENKPLLSTSSTSLVVPLASSHIASEWASNLIIDDADHRTICKFGGLDDPNYKHFKRVLQGFLKEIADEPVSNLNQQMSAIELEQLNRNKATCLKSLDFSKSKKPRNPTPGTCLWITGDPLFSKWYSGNQGTLWIQGKAGSGKSTLMNYLFETENEITAKRYPKVIVLFFSFFSQSQGLESSMKGLLRSFLYQTILQNESLAGPSIRAWLSESSKGDMAMHWNDIDELRGLLIETLSCGASQTRVSIYIDALNECEEHGESWLENIQFLTEALAGVRASTKFQARLIVSSQSTPRLAQAFGGLDIPTLVLEDHNSTDISTYLDHQIRAFKPLDPEFEAIIHRIRSQADGLFLWVRLVWENFMLKLLERRSVHGEYVSMTELEAILSSPHTKLNEIFRRMLDKVDSDCHLEATALLKLVVCAIRPLTIEEFRYALALGSASHSFKTEKDMLACHDFPTNNNDAAKRIKSRSGGLLEIKSHNEDRKTVQLIHESAKNYLLSLIEERSIFSSCDSGEGGHVYLSRACTNWLSIGDLDWLRLFYGREAPSFFHAYIRARQHFHFVEYAFSFWLQHIKEAEKSTQRSQAQFFLNPTALYLAMYQGLGQVNLASTGWIDFWRVWIIVRGIRDFRENVLGTPGPLCVAVSCHLPLTAVDLLDTHGISANEAGGFPLQCAFVNEWYEMVFVLLEHNAGIRWLAHRASTSYLDGIRNPLRVWIASQESSLEQADNRRALSLLLDKGFELPHPDEADLGSALNVAAVGGNVSMVRMLVERAVGQSTLESYLTSAFNALAFLSRDNDLKKTSEIVLALLSPVLEASLQGIASNALRKALQYIRNHWESMKDIKIESNSESQNNKHSGVSSCDQEDEDIDNMAIILFRNLNALDGRILDKESDAIVFEEFLESFKAQNPQAKLFVNRDGPVLYPGEENIFSPSFPSNIRRQLLSQDSPIFEGRPNLDPLSRLPAPSSENRSRPINYIFL